MLQHGATKRIRIRCIQTAAPIPIERSGGAQAERT
jgi:hypothetical protein